MKIELLYDILRSRIFPLITQCSKLKHTCSILSIRINNDMYKVLHTMTQKEKDTANFRCN